MEIPEFGVPEGDLPKFPGIDPSGKDPVTLDPDAQAVAAQACGDVTLANLALAKACNALKELVESLCDENRADVLRKGLDPSTAAYLMLALGKYHDTLLKIHKQNRQAMLDLSGMMISVYAAANGELDPDKIIGDA